MTHSVRERIIQAAVTALGTIAGVHVGRNKDVALKGPYPFITIFDGEHQTEIISYPQTNYSLTLEVTGYVQDDELGTAINALYASIVQKIMADWTLNG